MENLTCMYRFPSAPTLLMAGDQKTMIQFDVEKQKEIRVVSSYSRTLPFAQKRLKSMEPHENNYSVIKCVA